MAHHEGSLEALVRQEKRSSNIPQFKWAHPPLFHQTFYQSLPSRHFYKISILTFQIFNESLKANEPQPKYLRLF